jgi:hypothetical protein
MEKGRCLRAEVPRVLTYLFQHESNNVGTAGIYHKREDTCVTIGTCLECRPIGCRLNAGVCCGRMTQAGMRLKFVHDTT